MRKHIAPIMLLSLMAISPSMITSVHAQDAGTVTPAVATAATEYFVTLNGIRVRSTPEDAGKTMGLLSLNEKVRIVNPELINGKYVQIEIVKTVNKMMASEKYYVLREYLSEKVMDYKEFTGKYFTILNVATETLRLYERQCADNSCPHKMIMETEVVVGEDRDHPIAEKGKGRSVLGSYRLTGWAKFYQDAEAHYPAWYKDGYPAVPEVGAGFNKWMKNDFMPVMPDGKKHGGMRGAFGWYAGFVAPNPYGQWTHGTIGWGEDKDEYVKKTKKLVTNIISNPRSSGCTRNNNEAIAFLRQILDTGAPMMKIYAKEALLDKNLTDYRVESQEWQYIMTKTAGEKADRAEVLKSLGVSGQEVDAFWKAKRAGGQLILDPKSPLNKILEVGTYTVDTQPTVIEYTPGEKLRKLSRSVGRKGNVYGIDTKDMSNGVFYVDAGVVASSYSHPKAVLEVGGFEDEVIAPFMDVKNLVR